MDFSLSANEFTGEIICTGNEIISGRIADVNARYAAARLHEAGLTVQSITFLGDTAPLFQETLARGLSRSRFIIITGGLGPTEDDITAAATASVLQLPLHQDEYLLQRLRECFKERGLTWEDRFSRLALVPRGACILDPHGDCLWLLFETPATPGCIFFREFPGKCNCCLITMCYRPCCR